MTPQATFTDWIFFLLQVALSIAGIWLGIYLYLRQLQEAQNERYRDISKNLETLNGQVHELRNRLDSETTEIKAEIALVGKTASQTQTQIWGSYDKVVNKFISYKIPFHETQYTISKRSQDEPDSS